MNDSNELLALKQYLLNGMTEYMKFGGAENESDPDYDPNWDSGYTQEHVDRCDLILTEYMAMLDKMNGNGSPDPIIEATKKAVLALNDLNKEAGGWLIETDQREQICELMIRAGQKAGLDEDEDITGEWREW